MRPVFRLGLFALVVAGGAGAWQTTSWLQSRADGLTRYIRVDSWSVFRVLHELGELERDMARLVAGDPGMNRERLRRETAEVEAAVDLLARDAAGAVDFDNQSWRRAMQQAFGRFGRVRERILALDASGASVAELDAIDLELAPLRAALEEAASELGFVRLHLQDRDLQSVRRLIELARWTLSGFLTIACLLLLVMSLEARRARRAERAALQQERRFRDVAETASDWVFETDASMLLRFVSKPPLGPHDGASPADAQADEADARDAVPMRGGTGAGAAGEALLGRPLLGALKAVTSGEAGVSTFVEATLGRMPFRDVLVESRPDTEGADRRTFRISGKPYFDTQGCFAGYRGAGSDITAQIRQERHIRFLAEHDHLTRLPNRVLLRERLRQALAGARERDGRSALLALDLDGFKEVNDGFGHDVGDALLVAVAGRLSGLLRQGDLLARLGGDEFAILLAGGGRDEASARMLAERCIDAFRGAYLVAGREIFIQTSIGIATYPDHGDSVEELLKAADMALYAAKAAGRGRWTIYDPRMNSALLARQQIERALRRALQTGGLEVHFQPQMRLADDRLLGAEALVRWTDPTLGKVPPDLFVPVAEEAGLILELGTWVLEEACLQASRWPNGVVAVNVSPAQFLHGDLLERVDAALARSGLPPERLELEITEGVLMRDETAAIADLRKLHERGIQLAIDDFGTGYSSLSYLKRFPVDKVKIDRSFVTDLEHDADDRMIVKAIVTLGQALGLATIAEGVETRGQAEVLHRFGCDQGQGYLFGRPMPPELFGAFRDEYDKAKT
ncbi:MAG: EAL domain-containing protein [Geminicoccaceae bacterium]|nr:EAL domain-containing protein [Geminicoccaceae bacterium]